MSKLLITQFWNDFGYKGSKRSVSIRSYERTIQALKNLANLKDTFNPTDTKRNVFNKVKFHRHSLKSHALCFACKAPGEVRHHIIPLKHGGLNSKRNLVTLCRPCHAQIHPWL